MSMTRWLETRQMWRVITASLLLFTLALAPASVFAQEEGEAAAAGEEEEEKVETKIATVDDDKLQTEAPTLENEKKGTDVIRGENFAKARQFESLKKLDGQIQKIKKLISITPEDHPDYLAARDFGARMAEEGVTEEELQDAKTYLTGAYPLRFDGNGRIANILVGMQMTDLPIDYPETRNELVDAVTLEDINRVVDRIIEPERLHFVVVGKPAGLE